MPGPASRPLRILTLTTLFPHAAAPSHGVFVETRLKHLLGSGEVRIDVVAPVPWVPPGLRRHARHASAAAAPVAELRAGMRVVHPRYVVVPKVGMSLTPMSLTRAFARGMADLGVGADDIDLIDAHYFFPDGVAAAWLARRLGKPLVITGRGTDLNLIPAYPRPRRMIQEAARQAAGLITVCAALAEPLHALGVPAEKIRVLRNGVDLDLFAPRNRDALRAALGIRAPTLLSVGHLIERKGHHLVIQALAQLPDVHLLIAGDGEEQRALERLSRNLGLQDRIRFLGRKSQDELVSLYNAADALVLASSREGWANVLLEAMACGTPVVATPVWGTPEVVADPAAGLLAAERSAPALADAIRQLFAAPPARAATRAYAEGFSWQATTQGQLDLFRSVLAPPDSVALPDPGPTDRHLVTA